MRREPYWSQPALHLALLAIMLVKSFTANGLGEDACERLQYSELDAKQSIEDGYPIWKLRANADCSVNVSARLGGIPRVLHRKSSQCLYLLDLSRGQQVLVVAQEATNTPRHSLETQRFFSATSAQLW